MRNHDDSGLKDPQIAAMSPLPPQPSWVAKTPTPEAPPYYSPAVPPWRPAGLKPLSESLVFLSQVRSWCGMKRWLRLFFFLKKKDVLVLEFFFFLDESCCWFWMFFLGWTFFYWLGFGDGFYFGMMVVGFFLFIMGFWKIWDLFIPFQSLQKCRSTDGNSS